MRTLRVVVTLIASVFAVTLTGCAYRGAVYASYQELGLGIKAASAEANSPIKVHFGYDRGAGAWVPRRGGGQEGEEAVSLISRDDVRSTVNPTRLGQDSILEVDSALIAGTAAIVASSPPDATVTVMSPPPPPTAGAVAGAASGWTSATFRTTGSAGERIAVALSDSPKLSATELDVSVLLDMLDKRENRDAVFDAASARMPADFQQRYASGAGSGSNVAFRRAAFLYLQDSSDNDAAMRTLQDALQTANDEVP
jgi:hypothetical protein